MPGWLDIVGILVPITTPGRAHPDSIVARDGDRLWVQLDGRAHEIVWRDGVSVHAGSAEGDVDRVLRAPMPGSVVAVLAEPGTKVATGDPLIVIESMKLETTLRAAADGLVETVHVNAGETFERDAPLVTLANSHAPD